MSTNNTALTTLLLAACAAGCGRDATFSIDETRILPDPRPEHGMVLDAKTRMGLAGKDGGFVHPPMDGGAPAALAPSVFAWDLPQGWKEVSGTQLRAGNFVVPGREGLECYLTALPGGGGGLAANLNRWRKQMGLADASAAEIAALPRLPMLGGEATLLRVEGSFQGAAGSAMAAAALDRPGAAVFVKMTGRADDVRAELDRFRALCASLRDAAPAPAAPAAPGTRSLSWTAPEGWTQGPAKQMRVVTFIPNGTAGVECYVTVLGGKAGGVEANVNRWRGQLNLAPLSADALARLPTVEVLGRAAPWIEIDGGKLGMYGLVCELGTETVFVKMTGPMDVLRAERERFVAFCRSLS